MAWSYRRKIKIIPGVHLNFSRSGISTSIGIRGANLTLGKSGTYLNTGIPGTGIYKRQKISNSNSVPSTPVEISKFDLSVDNIVSADVQEITSQDMQGIRDAIILAHDQRINLKKDIVKIKTSIFISKLSLVSSYIFIYGLVKKDIKENIQSEIRIKKATLIEVKEHLENCYVGLDIDFEPEIEQKYLNVVESFKKLCTSHKIWDIVSAHSQDRIVTRSSASTLVKKHLVKFSIKGIPDIRSKYEPLCFKNSNGADLYFYPNFIVMYSSSKRFAIIGIDELSFYHSYVRFTETGIVPKDSIIIDKTWAKVNKNGTPDKRFKNNRQIPVVKYGEISLKTDTGLNEEYEFSNFEYTSTFGNAFIDYQSTIKVIGICN
ncbi:DUF4236 domain-containing protein [Flavobacterium sp.]|uniref:DUF4236 domain-containing protein n=1 Tax=Flavobacterium sp. TaxID=239 RepID=UPI00379AB528